MKKNAKHYDLVFYFFRGISAAFCTSATLVCCKTKNKNIDYNKRIRTISGPFLRVCLLFWCTLLEIASANTSARCLVVNAL